MSNDVTVSSWVIVRTGCPVASKVLDENQVEIRCGSARDGFEFVLETGALRELVRQGIAALDEIGPEHKMTGHVTPFGMKIQSK